MGYIASHLWHYNTQQKKFNAGDHVASLGDTGWADGIHLHLQDVPGATTITDFYRENCTGKVIRPNIEAMLDMNVYGITLDFMELWGNVYTKEKPHFGVDATHTECERLGLEQKLVFKVPIEIIETGFDKAFGNYIIFEVLWGQGTPTPEPQNKKMTEYFYNGWRNDEVIPFYASDLIDLGNGEYRLGQNSQGWLKDTRFR